jgi:Ca2+-binding RTX toxin-like protein
MSNNASKGYQFTLLNGQITGVSEIKNGRIKFERMDADEAWSYDAASGQVSKTEWGDGRLETTLYTDANGDGIFSKVSKSYGSLNTSIDTPVAQSQQEGYKFTVADGAVTGVFEIEHGTTRSKSMEAGETWTLQANQVIKTELEHGVTETTVYADANGDGIFAKVSKSYDVGGTLVTTPVTELSGDHGGLGSDDLQGSDFDDAYHGEGGNDHIDGQDGDDDLYGDAGHDSLTGGDGDDILVGGQGTDDLTGGSGADVFDFNNLTELGLGRTHDTIQDFRVGDHDKIDLSDMDANPLLAGNQAFVFLSGAPDAGNQTGTAWFNQGNLYLSTDADSAAEFEIAVVGVSALTAADLVL